MMSTRWYKPVVSDKEDSSGSDFSTTVARQKLLLTTHASSILLFSAFTFSRFTLILCPSAKSHQPKTIFTKHSALVARWHGKGGKRNESVCQNLGFSFFKPMLSCLNGRISHILTIGWKTNQKAVYFWNALLPLRSGNAHKMATPRTCMSMLSLYVIHHVELRIKSPSGTLR